MASKYSDWYMLGCLSESCQSGYKNFEKIEFAPAQYTPGMRMTLTAKSLVASLYRCGTIEASPRDTLSLTRDTRHTTARTSRYGLRLAPPAGRQPSRSRPPKAGALPSPVPPLASAGASCRPPRRSADGSYQHRPERGGRKCNGAQ